MLEHVDISHLSGYKTPATAAYFIEYNGENFDELREATQFAYSNNLPILTIAGGRNSLLAFDEYPGLVIYNNAQGYTIINNQNCPLDKGGQGGLEKLTHIPYNPELTQFSKDQRNTSSLAENRMWYDVLRHGELKKYRFLRQKPLLNFIADFYCSELGLVIEVDGDNHDKQQKYDQYRTEELEKYKLTVLRFHNLRVMEDPSGVEKEIINWIQLNPPLVPPLSRGHDGSFLISVASGHSIWELADELEKKHGINLWHRFLGLPGSVGGAVYGNAGCFGLDIGPYVTIVDIFDMKNGERFSKTGAELDFKYRWSECKNHPEWFLLSVTCDLSKKIEKYPAPPEDPLAWRERVQPEGLSCGSFFKNPSRENSAGSLLEKVGLKGHHHGGAYFSDKHANFLMSDGIAKWTDLVELVELAQKKVFELTGITLEPEVRIIQK